VTASGYGCRTEAMAETIELLRGGRVEGRVLSGTGSPVAGALVSAVGQDREGLSFAEARTDGGGSFSLAGLRPALPHMLILVAPGFGRMVFDLDPMPPGGLIRTGDIVLPAGRRIEGRVLTAAGDPVAEAEVDLRGENPDRGRFRTTEEPVKAEGATRETARTDDLGRFRFRDLAPGEYVVSARDPNEVERPVTLGVAADELGIDLRPAGETTFTVLVTDDASTPVAGAVVSVALPGGRHREQTDGNGQARFAVPPDTLEVSVSVEPPPGIPMLSAMSPAHPDFGECRLVLTRAAPVTGRVLGTDGTPLARATVVARWSESGGTMAATDVEGGFSILVPLGARADLSLPGEVAGRLEPIAGEASGVPAGTSEVVIRATRIELDRTLRVRVLSRTARPSPECGSATGGAPHRRKRGSPSFGTCRHGR